MKPEQRDIRADLGEHLRQERELRGIALEEVANVTRIRLAYLQNLENDEYAGLPEDVYVRGYIRAYARFLRIDAEACIAMYNEQAPLRAVGPVAVGSEDYPQPIIAPPLRSRLGDDEEGGLRRRLAQGTGGTRRLSLALVIVVILIVVGVLASVYYVNTRGNSGDSDAKSKPPSTVQDFHING